jgi:hypothetical protein
MWKGLYNMVTTLSLNLRFIQLLDPITRTTTAHSATTMKINVKLSLEQAVAAHGVVRCRSSPHF